MDPPPLDGLSGAALRVARALHELAEGRGVDVSYARADGRVVATLADFSGTPEVTMTSILRNGAFVRVLLLDDEAAEEMDCMDGHMFGSWPEGGMFQSRVADGDVADVLAAHEALLSHAVLEEQSQAETLRTMEDALLARRLSNRMGSRFGFWWGLEQAGFWDVKEAMGPVVREAEKALAEAPWLSRPVAWLMVRLLRGGVRWQAQAEGQVRLGVGEKLDVASLRALPIAPCVQAGSVGSWEPLHQEGAPEWSVFRRIWEGGPIDDLLTDGGGALDQGERR